MLLTEMESSILVAEELPAAPFFPQSVAMVAKNYRNSSTKSRSNL
jgi:hypothetical protein